MLKDRKPLKVLRLKPKVSGFQNPEDIKVYKNYRKEHLTALKICIKEFTPDTCVFAIFTSTLLLSTAILLCCAADQAMVCKVCTSVQQAPIPVA